MEGLNKMCLSINLRHEYPSMHGRIQSQPVGPGPSSRHRISNQRGITHINNGIGLRTNGHTFDPLFSPLTSAKNSCFYQKLSPKSSIFSTLSKILEIFHSKTPNSSKSAGIWEKGTQMPPIFMAFVTERPLFFCLVCTCLRRMLLPQTRSAEAGKFCILETELCNLVNTFRTCKLKIMVIKTKFQF